MDVHKYTQKFNLLTSALGRIIIMFIQITEVFFFNSIKKILCYTYSSSLLVSSIFLLYHLKCLIMNYVIVWLVHNIGCLIDIIPTNVTVN